MSDRCTGHCCRMFYLPFSPAELAENYRAWRAKEDKDANGRNILQDIWLLAPMVKHEGMRTRNPLGTDKTEYPPSNYYSCKHLAPNGDCTVYEMRPTMCREYPYGKACGYSACSWDAGKKPELVQIGGQQA